MPGTYTKKIHFIALGMEFSPSIASEVGAAPDEIARNSVSASHHELLAFLRTHGCVSAGDGAVYHILDRGAARLNHKNRFDDPQDMVQFLELAEDCRRDDCVLHILEHLPASAPAGIMIDLDRKQEAPAPSIFTQDALIQLANIVKNIIDEMVVGDDEPAPDPASASERALALMYEADAADAVDAVDASDAPDATVGARCAVARSTTPAMDRARACALVHTCAPVRACAPARNPLDFHIFIIKRSKITLDPASRAYKDGIHILVPEIWLSKPAREMVIARVRERIPLAFADSLDADAARDLVDRNSYSVQPHLIGSCKPGGILYNLVYAACARHVGRESGTMNTLSVDELIAGRSRAPAEGGIPINLVYELSLTITLDEIRGCPTWLRKRAVELPAKIAACVARITRAPVVTRAARERDFADSIAAFIGCDAEFKYIHELTELLPRRYADDRALWRNVVFVLADISCGPRARADDRYKLLAQCFSMRSSKWDPRAFEELWRSAIARGASNDTIARGDATDASIGRPRRVTMRSLECWVRAEDPAGYERVKSADARSFLAARVYQNGGAIDHNTIAGVLYRSLRGLYTVDTDAADHDLRKGWFEFVLDTTEHAREEERYKWRHMQEPHAMFTMISEHIYALCLDVAADIGRREGAAVDDGQRAKYAGVAKLFGKMMISLRSDKFQDSVIRQARHLLYTRDFAASMDTQPYVIGVGNGVLEFAREGGGGGMDLAFEPRLIQSYHEHRVSRFTETRYVPYDAESPIVREILRAYRDIYVEPDVCEFMLFYLSTWLDACDSGRTLVLLGGGGSNGKTWSVYFPQCALTDKYACVLRMQLLTEGHEHAKEANSAMMSLKGLRGGYFDEANEGDALNAARVKAIVTPGSQTGRELYRSEERFRNTANMIAISNYDFVVNATDNGSWDRLYFYQCKMRFVAHPDPASPYERARCSEMTTRWVRDARYLSAMLSILVHYRVRLEREYGGDIRAIPVESIARETRAFRMKQDPLTRFICERMVQSPRVNTSARVLADAYIAWYREAVGTRPRSTDPNTLFQNSRIADYMKRESEVASARG
ncbi:MAG: PriCT-2 domain-containing protein, partial [Candidatus Omnitrophica bacterium]|nr:PriCT-2 domain-containing protein [Candidatus Omnitrophota bacterium]